MQDKDVRVGKASVDDIIYLRQNRLLPLATLLQVDHSSPYYHDEQKSSVFYAESWALTHLLEIGDADNKTHRVQTYSILLQKHVDSLTAAKEAFGDLTQLQKQLDSYVSQSNFKEFKLTAPVVFTESSLEVHPIPTPEADAIRADVLLDVRRTKDAEDLLATVLHDDPSNALAHETMGSLKFREGNIPAAKDWYTQAVHLDSQSYLAHYYFAVFSLQSGEHGDDDAIEKSLRTSIKLNPRFAPSFDALAHFYAARHEKLDEAHILNVTAVGLEPENLNYRLNAAEVLAENHQLPDAIRVLEAAKPLAKTTEDTYAITSRLAQMDRMQSYENEASERPSHLPSDGSVTLSLGAGGAHPAPLAAVAEPAFPDGNPASPRHTASGIVHSVKCTYPTVLTLTLDRPGKTLRLYTNNYFKVPVTTPGDDSTAEMHPCQEFEGRKAKIEYSEVTAPRVTGQILSIELNK